LRRRTIFWLLLGYLVLRWVLLTAPGYLADVWAYKRWAVLAAQFGLPRIYETSDLDYPPLYMWVLTPLGHLYGVLDPERMAALEDSTLLSVLIKFPPLVFDFLIGWLAWRIGRRIDRHLAARAHGEETTPGATPRGNWRWILPAAYLLNPAVLFDVAWWGQTDSIHSFFVLAAFLSLGSKCGSGGFAAESEPRAGGPRGSAYAGRVWSSAWPAWVLLTLATLMKPLGAPFFPLLLVLSLVFCGFAATIAGAAASVLTGLLVFSPFLLTGRMLAVAKRVVGDVGLMAFTSSNAHNLWWALGPWRNSEVPWLGPVTATQVGLALFGIFYAGLLWKAHRLHRSQEEGLTAAQVIALALAVGFAFFMLSTHMHENHLFIVLPLALPLLVRGPNWRWFYLAATAGVLANLVLHDATIPLHWPFTIGGPSPVINNAFQRRFAWGEIVMIWISTLFNLALFGIFLYRMFARGGWLERLRGTPRVSS
jgi:hypothetical protein